MLSEQDRVWTQVEVVGSRKGAISLFFMKAWPGLAHISFKLQITVVLDSPSPAPLLIISDSIIRNICSRAAVTHCLPGATISDITEKLPGILLKYPHVQKVIVLVGTNDTSLKQLEVLKLMMIL